MGHRNFLEIVFVGVEPKSFKEAKKDSSWREPVRKEIGTLENNETWSMKTLFLRKKALGCRV